MLVTCCVGAHAFGGCGASFWQEYRGTQIWRFPELGAYLYVVNRMTIDADGAPNAYHPDDVGIDSLRNAEYPNGKWRNILALDPDDTNKPFIQKTGEYTGYFVSKTSLYDRKRPETDIGRYVNAVEVPCIVFPGAFFLIKGTGGYGDFVLARRLGDREATGAIVADGGPRDDPLGEVSIALAGKLGGSHVNPRTGHGIPDGPFLYAVFPYSKSQPSWPISDGDLQLRAKKHLDALGGWERILPCIPPTPGQVSGRR